MMKHRKHIDVSELDESAANPCGAVTRYRDCPVCGAGAWELCVDHKAGVWMCHAGRHSGGGKLTGHGVVPCHLSRITNAVEFKPLPDDVYARTGTLMQAALRYLRSRGLSPNIITKSGIREWYVSIGHDRLKARRLWIPYLVDGVPAYYSTRTYQEGEICAPKYMHMVGKKPLYVLEGSKEKLVIVEGVFDALAVHDATGYTAVALSGKTLPAHLMRWMLELIGTHEKTAIFLDSDAIEAAYGLAIELQHVIEAGVYTGFLKPGQDPGSISHELIREILAQ